MAGIKDTASTYQSSKRLLDRGKRSRQRSTVRQAKSKPRTKTLKTPKRRQNMLRFREVTGKTVAFVEMDWSAEYPCVEVAFNDRTALLIELGARITMEPMYSDWKTGNQRVLGRWQRRET